MKLLKVHFTKAKIFFHHDGKGEQRYQVTPGVHTNVPAWVKTTLGWEMGVKDGSIVDLTPPEPLAAAEPKPTKAKPAVQDDDPGAQEPALEEPEDGEGKPAEDEPVEEEDEPVAEAKPLTAKQKAAAAKTHGLQK